MRRYLGYKPSGRRPFCSHEIPLVFGSLLVDVCCHVVKLRPMQGHYYRHNLGIKYSCFHSLICCTRLSHYTLWYDTNHFKAVLMCSLFCRFSNLLVNCNKRKFNQSRLWQVVTASGAVDARLTVYIVSYVILTNWIILQVSDEAHCPELPRTK